MYRPFKLSLSGFAYYMPLLLANIYILFTYSLYLWGPIDWPKNNLIEETGLISTILIALSAGYFFGTKREYASDDLKHWRFLFRAGALFAVVMLFPASYVYTGKWPWQVVQAFICPGKSYYEMLIMAQKGDVSIRQKVSVLIALASPFILCALPFGLMLWGKLRIADKVLLLLAILSPLTFSILRGTDKETADVVLTLAVLVLIKLGCFLLDVRNAKARRELLIFALLAIFSVSAAYVLFDTRKKARYMDACTPKDATVSWTPQYEGGDKKDNWWQSLLSKNGGLNLSEDQREESQVRAAEESVSADDMDNVKKLASTRFGLIAAYATQGYHGLSIALGQKFESTYGLGHSPLLMEQVGKRISADFYKRSYLYKTAQKGWSDTGHWSSIVPWIASDIGFCGVPVFFAVFGFFFAQAWKDIIQNRRLLPVPFFYMSCMLILYFPANNQIFGTLGSYFSVLVWFALWRGFRFVPGRFKAGSLEA